MAVTALLSLAACAHAGQPPGGSAAGAGWRTPGWAPPVASAPVFSTLVAADAARAGHAPVGRVALADQSSAAEADAWWTAAGELCLGAASDTTRFGPDCVAGPALPTGAAPRAAVVLGPVRVEPLGRWLTLIATQREELYNVNCGASQVASGDISVTLPDGTRLAGFVGGAVGEADSLREVDAAPAPGGPRPRLYVLATPGRMSGALRAEVTGGEEWLAIADAAASPHGSCAEHLDSSTP
ncbi:hypothetical protein ABT095_24215 [Kitasatospora sp. NPDC002227]|uniref:hypothetical protein n=1 Tax=Kitasatospora sp. NPDC002227 TaxID=3154773 RepID=UPI00332C05C0